MRDSLDSCENVTFYVKTATFTFWATFGKFGLLFIPTSGHTDHILRMRIRRDERQKREGEKNKKVSTGKDLLKRERGEKRERDSVCLHPLPVECTKRGRIWIEMKRTLASGKRHSAAPIDPIYKLLLLFPVVVAIAGAVVRNCSLPEWTTPKKILLLQIPYFSYPKSTKKERDRAKVWKCFHSEEIQFVDDIAKQVPSSFCCLKMSNLFRLCLQVFKQTCLPNVFFLKMGHSRPLFLYFRLFNTQLTVNNCSIYE